MREERRTVYEYLLEEGVIVLKKDFNLPEHNDTKVSNLKVWMLLRSLHSKGMVELVFNWQWYYYYVKTEGVAHLRDCLGITEDKVVPVTFKKTKKDFVGREEGEKRERRGERRERGERGERRERGERGERAERGYGRGRGRTEEGEKPQGEDKIVEVNYETKEE